MPNFGVDQDIIDSHKNLAKVEDDLSHKLIMGTKASKAKWHNVAKDTMYNFAPTLDADIRATQKHLSDTQTKLGHRWVIEDLQLDESSDPICSSAGCSQYKHKKTPLGYPINYPVPNLGTDKDILDSHSNLKNAEDTLSHKLEMGTKESKARRHNVAKDTNYDFAPKLDSDIRATQKHLSDTQTKLGHHWVIEDL